MQHGQTAALPPTWRRYPWDSRGPPTPRDCCWDLLPVWRLSSLQGIFPPFSAWRCLSSPSALPALPCWPLWPGGQTETGGEEAREPQLQQGVPRWPVLCCSRQLWTKTPLPPSPPACSRGWARTCAPAAPPPSAQEPSQRHQLTSPARKPCRVGGPPGSPRGAGRLSPLSVPQATASHTGELLHGPDRGPLLPLSLFLCLLNCFPEDSFSLSTSPSDSTALAGCGCSALIGLCSCFMDASRFL